MLLLEATQKLDFSAVEGGGDGPWLFAVIVGAGIVIVTFCMYAMGEDGLVVIFGLILGGGAFAFIMFVGSSHSESHPTEQKTELQSWVAETYLIDLTDGQTADLLENQVDLKDSEPGEATENAILTKNSYGDVVSVTLVKDEKNYVLIQSNNELPATTKEK